MVGVVKKTELDFVSSSAALAKNVARHKRQERFLQAHFGAEYERYRARTSRLIPGLY